MSYLSQGLRQKMRNTVLDHAFKAKTEAAKKELILAGDALYMAHHGEHLKTMQKLPPEFLYASRYMDSNIGGQRHQVKLSEVKLMSYKSNCSRIVFEASDTAAIAYLQANDKVNDIESQRETMSNKVTAILESVRTFKKLWEVWPEAKPLLEKFEDKPTVALLPAIQFDQINTELGLPPSTNDIPWTHRLKASGGFEIGYFGQNGFVKTDEAATIEAAKAIVNSHNGA